jgi:ribosomal protein L21E
MTQSAAKKSSRKKAPRKSSQRKGQKNLQRFTQEILPGDLVTIEEFVGDIVATDYTGSVLGIVQKVKGKRITTVWTANTAMVPVWLLPETNEYEAGALKSYRFKVLSRKVEWVKVA